MLTVLNSVGNYCLVGLLIEWPWFCVYCVKKKWESLEAVERNVLPEMTAGKWTHTGQPLKVRLTLATFFNAQLQFRLSS